jgi:hypothetical protein
MRSSPAKGGRKIAPCPRVGDRGEEDGIRAGGGRGGEDESAPAAVKWSLGATLRGGGEGASVAEATRTGCAPAAVEAGRRGRPNRWRPEGERDGEKEASNRW